MNTASKTVIATALLYGVALLTSPMGYAQNCEAALRDGVFNDFKMVANEYSSMVLAMRLSQMTASEARKKIDAGGSAVIDGLPVGGNFTDQQFEAWRQEVRKSVDFSSIQRNERSISHLTASSDLLREWNNCNQLLGGVISQLAARGATAMVYSIRFAPRGSVTSAEIVHDIEVTGGKILNRDIAAALKKGRFITAAETKVQIARESLDTPVVITLNTKEGAAEAFVPAIVKLPPFPTKPLPDTSKWYWIESVSYRGYALNVFGAHIGKVTGPLCIAPAHSDQRFRFLVGAKNAFHIIASAGGKSVGRLTGQGGPRDAIVQADIADFQMWFLDNAGQGRYRLKSVLGDDYVGVHPESANPGPHHALRISNKADAELWTLSEQGDVSR
jgi:hypothetical protein